MFMSGDRRYRIPLVRNASPPKAGGHGDDEHCRTCPASTATAADQHADFFMSK
jgi:hypothetical protein